MQFPNVELQPKGGFVISLAGSDGQALHIKGRFSMAAIDRFCNSKQIESYIELVKQITMGMTLRDYALLILEGIRENYSQNMALCPWTEDTVFSDILEEINPGGEHFMALINHAVGRVVPLKKSPEQDQQDAKKNPSPGTSTG